MKHRAGQNFGHDTFDINELVYHIIVTIAFYHLATQLPRAPTVANPISRTGSVGTFNKPHSSTERKPRKIKGLRPKRTSPSQSHSIVKEQRQNTLGNGFVLGKQTHLQTALQLS
jgi:hypothetical protein